jgi:phosphoribosylformylglycinamidine cyclo-ligase
VSDDEMGRVFNLGIGMVAVVPPDQVMRAHDVLRSHGVGSVEIGEVVAGEGAVQLI